MFFLTQKCEKNIGIPNMFPNISSSQNPAKLRTKTNHQSCHIKYLFPPCSPRTWQSTSAPWLMSIRHKPTTPCNAAKCKALRPKRSRWPREPSDGRVGPWGDDVRGRVINFPGINLSQPPGNDKKSYGQSRKVNPGRFFHGSPDQITQIEKEYHLNHPQTPLIFQGVNPYYLLGWSEFIPFIDGKSTEIMGVETPCQLCAMVFVGDVKMEVQHSARHQNMSTGSYSSISKYVWNTNL